MPLLLLLLITTILDVWVLDVDSGQTLLVADDVLLVSSENLIIVDPRGITLSVLVTFSFVQNSTRDIMSTTKTLTVASTFFFTFAFFVLT